MALRTGMQRNLAVKDQFWEGPIFHSGAIRVGDANVLANGSAGGIQEIYRAAVFPGARATREVWAALVRDGRCSRVARGGKAQVLPRGRQERQRFSHGCWPRLTLTRSGTERCERPGIFQNAEPLAERGFASGSAEATRHRLRGPW